MWFVLALFAGLLFAANRLIFRFAFTRGTRPLAFLAIHELLAGALLLPFAISAFSLPGSARTWIAAMLTILFIFLADLFATLSLNRIEASLYQIVGQLRHVVVLFGAYFLFAEVITLSKVVSVSLIMIGVAVAILDKTNIKVSRGVVDAALSTLFIAGAFLFVKMAAVDVKPVVLASFSLLGSGVLCYALQTYTEKHPVRLRQIRNRPQLFAAAAIFAVFELTLFTALDTGEASKVTPVTQSSLIFTLVGGYLFLDERKRLTEKIIGSSLITAGIGLLYFY